MIHRGGIWDLLGVHRRETVVPPEPEPEPEAEQPKAKVIDSNRIVLNGGSGNKVVEGNAIEGDIIIITDTKTTK